MIVLPSMRGYLRSGYDPDAADYFDRIVAAGSSISNANKLAVDAFVKGCKADGIWSAIKASCLLAGPDDLTGALVPLVGAAPTNVSGNFVSGDYDRTTGLVGDGSTKYLDANRNNNADPQNSNHMAAYHAGTAATDIGSILLGIPASSTTGNNLLASRLTRCRNNTSNTGFSNAAGFSGFSRSSSSEYLRRNNSTTSTIASTSQNPQNATIAVFRSGVGYSLHRISYYSIGEALDLALLDARLTTYMSALS